MDEYRHPIKKNEDILPIDSAPNACDGYLRMEIRISRDEDGSIENAVMKCRAVDHLE